MCYEYECYEFSNDVIFIEASSVSSSGREFGGFFLSSKTDIPKPVVQGR